MFRSSSRILLVSLLLAVLTVPCAWAGEPAAARSGGAALSFVDLLNRAWQGLVSLWMDNGCIIDPNGRCAAAPTVDNGCGIDPSGRCAAAATVDNGCIIDPHGCRSGS
jgi:hypothetical protein